SLSSSTPGAARSSPRRVPRSTSSQPRATHHTSSSSTRPTTCCCAATARLATGIRWRARAAFSPRSTRSGASSSRSARADKVIDTTYLTVKDLRDTLHSLYGGATTGMLVHVTSFGYKNGVPPGADLVFDVRFMENPFYIPELRPKTGRDPEVRDFVLRHPATQEFLSYLMPLLRFALPRYEDEKKARLGVAFGCTGGWHRSVVIADEVAKR